jgi:hypothetical protein
VTTLYLSCCAVLSVSTMPDPSRVTIETSVPKDSVGPNKPTSPNPDAFFLSPSSLIGVELKLDSPTWPEQIGKYLALMVWEELKGQKEAKEGKKERENLGLLFVVPEKVREQHLSKIGVDGPNLPSDFLGRLRPSKLPTRIRRLFEDNPETLDSVRSRVRLASVSWTTLRDQISKIESELDRHSRGDQTLLRLLTGLRTQIEKHGKTGIPRPPDSSS